MRSMKLLVATAMLAAFVAGPVLAQDAGGSMTPSTTSTETAKPAKHHGTKKPKRHKKTTASTTDSTTVAK